VGFYQGSDVQKRWLQAEVDSCDGHTVLCQNDNEIDSNLIDIGFFEWQIDKQLTILDIK
jgi:hypothetical protein